MSGTWVNQLGLAYNPYKYVEASSDPHLGDYLIGHHVSTHIRRQEPLLVFAPHGGGKTALRLLAGRQAWIERRALPVAYLLPTHTRYQDHATFAEHLRGIVRATAIALWIAIAFRPELALSLNSAQLTQLVTLLDAHLPARLAHYLAILRDEGTPAVLAVFLDRVVNLPDPPHEMLVHEFCDKLEKHLPASQSSPSSIEQSWRAQCEFIFDTFAFPALELLVDGVDATPRTFANPDAEVRWLAPLLEHAPRWADQKIFLKAFLPEDAQHELLELSHIRANFGVTSIEWSPSHLTEMLRRRLYAASHGIFNSLNVIAAPDVQEIESQIANTALPRPREAIALTQRVLDSYAARLGAHEDNLTAQDLERAFKAYRSEIEQTEITPANLTNELVPV